MVGVILGLISAAVFGANTIIVRRGTLRSSSNYVATITIISGPIFFLALAAVTGDLLKLGDYSWKAWAFMALSGICHFALGRTWGYRSIELIGSTRSTIVTGLNPIVTTVLATIILHETITFFMLIGILCTLAAPLLILSEQVGATQLQRLCRKPVHGSTGLSRVPRFAGFIFESLRTNGESKGSPRTEYGTLEINYLAVRPERVEGGTANYDTVSQAKGLDRKILYKGVFYGLGAALFWGSSSIFIKLGLEEGGSPIAGSLVAYLAALIAIVPSSFLKKENREELLTGDRGSLELALLSGLSINVAQLLRYLALGFAPAIVVTLMLRTSPLWLLCFAFLFNRKDESFSGCVLLGNGLLLVGTLLILIP